MFEIELNKEESDKNALSNHILNFKETTKLIEKNNLKNFILSEKFMKNLFKSNSPKLESNIKKVIKEENKQNKFEIKENETSNKRNSIQNNYKTNFKFYSNENKRKNENLFLSPDCRETLKIFKILKQKDQKDLMKYIESYKSNLNENTKKTDTVKNKFYQIKKNSQNKIIGSSKNPDNFLDKRKSENLKNTVSDRKKIIFLNPLIEKKFEEEKKADLEKMKENLILKKKLNGRKNYIKKMFNLMNNKNKELAIKSREFLKNIYLKIEILEKNFNNKLQESVLKFINIEKKLNFILNKFQEINSLQQKPNNLSIFQNDNIKQNLQKSLKKNIKKSDFKDDNLFLSFFKSNNKEKKNHKKTKKLLTSSFKQEEKIKDFKITDNKVILKNEKKGNEQGEVFQLMNKEKLMEVEKYFLFKKEIINSLLLAGEYFQDITGFKMKNVKSFMDKKKALFIIPDLCNSELFCLLKKKLKVSFRIHKINLNFEIKEIKALLEKIQIVVDFHKKKYLNGRIKKKTKNNLENFNCFFQKKNGKKELNVYSFKSIFYFPKISTDKRKIEIELEESLKKNLFLKKQLQNQIDDLTNKLHDLNNKNDLFLQESEKNKFIEKDLKDQIKKFLINENIFKKNIDEKESLINLLQKQKDDKKNDLNILFSENKKLKNEVENIFNKNICLEKENKNKDKEIENLKTFFEDFKTNEAENNLLKLNQNKIYEEKEKISDEKNEIEKIKNNLHKENEKIKKAYEILISENTNLLKEENALKLKFEKINQEFFLLENDKKFVDEKNFLLEKKIKTLEEEFISAKNKIINLEEYSENKNDLLIKEIKELKKENEFLIKNKSEIYEEKINLEKDLCKTKDEFIKEKNYLVKELNEIIEKNKEVKEIKARFAEEINEKNKMMESKEKEFKDIIKNEKYNLEKAKKKNDYLKQIYEKQKNDYTINLQKEKENYDKLNYELLQLNNELKKKDEMEKELLKEKDINQSLKKELLNLNNNLNNKLEIEEQLLKEKDINNSLKKELLQLNYDLNNKVEIEKELLKEKKNYAILKEEFEKDKNLSKMLDELEKKYDEEKNKNDLLNKEIENLLIIKMNLIQEKNTTDKLIENLEHLKFNFEKNNKKNIDEVERMEEEIIYLKNKIGNTLNEKNILLERLKKVKSLIFEMKKNKKRENSGAFDFLKNTWVIYMNLKNEIIKLREKIKIKNSKKKKIKKINKNVEEVDKYTKEIFLGIKNRLNLLKEKLSKINLIQNSEIEKMENFYKFENISKIDYLDNIKMEKSINFSKISQIKISKKNEKELSITNTEEEKSKLKKSEKISNCAKSLNFNKVTKIKNNNSNTLFLKGGNLLRENEKEEYIKQLETNINNFQNSFKEILDENNSLKITLENINNNYISLKDRNNDIILKYDDLKDKFFMEKTKLTKLEEIIANYSSKENKKKNIANLEKEKVFLAEENNYLNKNINELKKKIEEKMNLIAKLEIRINEKNKQSDEEREIIVNKIEQIEELKNSNFNLKEEIEKYTEQIKNLTYQLNRNEEKFKFYEAFYIDYHKENKKEKVNELETKIQKLTKKNEDFKKILNSLENNNKNYLAEKNKDIELLKENCTFLINTFLIQEEMFLKLEKFENLESFSKNFDLTNFLKKTDLLNLENFKLERLKQNNIFSFYKKIEKILSEKTKIMQEQKEEINYLKNELKEYLSQNKKEIISTSIKLPNYKNVTKFFILNNKKNSNLKKFNTFPILKFEKESKKINFLSTNVFVLIKQNKQLDEKSFDNEKLKNLKIEFINLFTNYEEIQNILKKAFLENEEIKNLLIEKEKQIGNLENSILKLKSNLNSNKEKENKKLKIIIQNKNEILNKIGDEEKNLQNKIENVTNKKIKIEVIKTPSSSHSNQFIKVIKKKTYAISQVYVYFNVYTSLLSSYNKNLVASKKIVEIADKIKKNLIRDIKNGFLFLRIKIVEMEKENNLRRFNEEILKLGSNLIELENKRNKLEEDLKIYENSFLNHTQKIKKNFNLDKFKEKNLEKQKIDLLLIMICEFFELGNNEFLFYENCKVFFENLQYKMEEEKEIFFILKQSKENFKNMLDEKCQEVEGLKNKNNLSFEILNVSKISSFFEETELLKKLNCYENDLIIKKRENNQSSKMEIEKNLIESEIIKEENKKLKKKLQLMKKEFEKSSLMKSSSNIYNNAINEHVKSSLFLFLIQFLKNGSEKNTLFSLLCKHLNLNSQESNILSDYFSALLPQKKIVSKIFK